MRLSKTIFEQVKPMQWRSQKCVLVRGEQSKACFSYPERGAVSPRAKTTNDSLKWQSLVEITHKNPKQNTTKTQNKIPQKTKIV